MPFENERSNKTSHGDVLRNPDVTNFLAQCKIMTPPTEEEAKAFASQFVEAPSRADVDLPATVVALDGSLYESQVYPGQLPSTRVGYVKVSTFMIDTQQFAGIVDQGSGLVDPFRLAKLQDDASALALALPGPNVRYDGRATVREGFRAALEKHFLSPNTWVENDPKRSLRATLFELAANRSPKSALYTGDATVIRLHKCPNCDELAKPGQAIEVRDVAGSQHCPFCGGEVFATDCLRIWETVAEGAPIGEALGRTMSVVEHIMPMHYARNIAAVDLNALAGLMFFVDGPLAVFGNAAWIHAGILRTLHKLNALLIAKGREPMHMLGLQKTGALREHVDLIERFVQPDRILPVSDDYRYTHVSPRDLSQLDPSDEIGFGLETYYGQDFIYKTPGSKTFIFAVPYPFAGKSEAKAQTGKPFKDAKLELHRYPHLARILKVLDYFESDLYTNASIPLALAHQHTAISLMPGGKVLDIMTHKKLST
jgi:hypothetical protein